MTRELVVNDVDTFLPFRTITPDNEIAYVAGLPGYCNNFSRDGILAAIIAGDGELLASQMEISAKHQGVNDDPVTGEQKGKIHHQLPGAQLSGREGLTTYNACDTTAIFMIGAEALRCIDPSTYAEFFAQQHTSLRNAVDYILARSNTGDDLFWDQPPAGVDRYNLRVTYWKDSILPRGDGIVEPTYPVSYGLARFMAARGVLSAAKIFDDSSFRNIANSMYQAGIHTFMGNGNFTVYKDAKRKLKQASSDELHSLAYIPPYYKRQLPLSSISMRASGLATDFGYMCTPLEIGEKLSDRYHGDRIWVFEQPLIHYGAEKFGLHDEANVAQLIAPHIGRGEELFGLSDGRLVPVGNPEQLWSVGADIYFKGGSNLRLNPWL